MSGGRSERVASVVIGPPAGWIRDGRHGSWVRSCGVGGSCNALSVSGAGSGERAVMTEDTAFDPESPKKLCHSGFARGAETRVPDPDLRISRINCDNHLRNWANPISFRIISKGLQFSACDPV
jgi:hypothetical protein